MHRADSQPPNPTHGATLVIDADERPPTNADDLETDALAVLTFKHHEDWLDAVYSDPGGGPDALICAGEMIRSAAATVATEDDTGPRVVDIASATDLGQIAVEVTDAIDNLRTSENDVALVLDGLETLLDAVEVERAFRLIHVLRGHTRGGEDDFTAYLDPTGVAAETRVVLEPLFDRVLEDENIPSERREHVGL